MVIKDFGEKREDCKSHGCHLVSYEIENIQHMGVSSMSVL
jgi:hypothetical protein